MMKNVEDFFKVFWVLILLALSESYAQDIFQYCDNQFNLATSPAFLESPYYPNYYPPNTACRYKFTAPANSIIQATCTVETDNAPGRCTTENVYVSVEGDSQLRGSENFCGTGQFTRTSLFNQLVIAYISKGSWGRFKCRLDVIAQPCDCGWSATSRIVNGEQARINEFPSTVALKDLTSSLSNYCGGTIVSSRYVLTAAHCANIQPNPSNVAIYAGDHDLSSSSETLYAAIYYALQIIKHPNYVSQPQVQNDIALVKTTTDMQWSRGVGPICIPPANMVNANLDYKYVNLVGWGTTSFGGVKSSLLRKALVHTIPNSVCQKEYPSDTVIYNSQICTASNENKDACQYDSGGPAIYSSTRQFQLGIISFGKPCGIGTPTVGVNTRLTSYGSWINQTVGYTLCAKSM